MHIRSQLLIITLFFSFVSLQAFAADTQQNTQTQSDYLIGPGDVLMVSIWKDESLTQEVVVLPDGTISFPLIGIDKG